MHYLERNAYLIDGRVNAAFYDFNHGRLVHVSEEGEKLLRRVLGHEADLTSDEESYLDNLSALGLLSSSFMVMPYEDFCHVIDELVSFGVRKIQLIGGEPLTLGDSLTRYLDYLAGKFEYAEIFTNGTLLTDSLIAYIKAHRIRLALSMYSYLEDEHDKVTQIPGSWAKTSEAVRKLRDNGITYTAETQQSVREKVYQRS